MPLTQLRISQLTLDPRCQARVAFSEAHAEDLAELRRRGIAYRDPLVVFQDGKWYYLADGFHRLRGEELAGGKTVLCDVRKGTVRDAIWYAAGANKLHALGRSHEDKRRAVLVLLTDEEWGDLENTRIATHCGVSEGLVRTLRGELREEEKRAREAPSTNGTGQGGSYNTTPTAVIDRIATSRKPRSAPEPDPPAIVPLSRAERLADVGRAITKQISHLLDLGGCEASLKYLRAALKYLPTG